MLTQSDVKRLLHYDPDTGVFVWLHRRELDEWNTKYAGKQAGVLRPDGYRKITIAHKSYLGSRLAWLWMSGDWPSKKIDHRNGTPSDDRWANLRLATESQIKANQKLSKRNTIGLKGVSFHKARGKYTAQCRHQHLGLFDTAEDAHAAYLAAAKKHFGEFARGG